MKIITFGRSPYLLNSHGRVHKNIIKVLSKSYDVKSIVWDHDSSYFMPENDGRSYFEDLGVKTLLLPVDKSHEKCFSRIESFIREHNPDIVLGIGDYFDFDEIYALKTRYPGLFYFLGMFLCRSELFEKSYKKYLDIVDYALISNSAASVCFEQISSCPFSIINPGYDNEVFKYSKKEKSLKIVSNLKNCQSDNPAAFISTVALLKQYGLDFEAYLHTNIDDEGFYDLKDLIRRFDVSDILSLPNDYVSVREGCTDAHLSEIYQSSAIYYDPSIYSACGMSLLESMACGCIPVTTKKGASKDVCKNLYKDCFVSSSSFLGERGQYIRVISDVEAAKNILRISENLKKDFQFIYSNCCLGVSNKTTEHFSKKLLSVIDNMTSTSKFVLPVEI